MSASTEFDSRVPPERRDDLDWPAARESVEQAGAHAAGDHLDLAGRQRRHGVHRRGELLQSDVDPSLLEVAFLDADVKRRIRNNAEVGDADDVLRLDDQSLQEQHDEKQFFHWRSSVSRFAGWMGFMPC